MAKYLQFYGLPCVGKSTLAMETFVKLKQMGKRVEFCREVFKTWTYDKNWRLRDPFSCFSAQYLENTQYDNISQDLDFIIQESPLPLVACWENPTELMNFIMRNIQNDSCSYAFYIEPGFTYDKIGRNPEIPGDLESRIKQQLVNCYDPDWVFKGTYEEVRNHINELIISFF